MINATPTIETSIEPHAPHWLNRAAFQVLILLFFLVQVSLGFAVYRANYWLVVPLALISSHLMHGLAIGFHEASHGLLRKNRLLNEFDGILIGIFSLMSFSLYRAAHQLHHAYLASERDEELWPFVHPQMPRGTRVLSAALELTMGLLFTPYLFMRTFLRGASPIRNKKLRRRIWTEFAVTAAKSTVQTTAAIANSIQMRRRNFRLRMGEPRRRKVLTKRNGVNSIPIVSSSTAARTRTPRGICGWTKGQSSSSRSEAR